MSRIFFGRLPFGTPFGVQNLVKSRKHGSPKASKIRRFSKGVRSSTFCTCWLPKGRNSTKKQRFLSKICSNLDAERLCFFGILFVLSLDVCFGLVLFSAFSLVFENVLQSTVFTIDSAHPDCVETLIF